MGFGLTPSFGDRRGFMPPQLKTKQTSTGCITMASCSTFIWGQRSTSERNGYSRRIDSSVSNFGSQTFSTLRGSVSHSNCFIPSWTNDWTYCVFLSWAHNSSPHKWYCHFWGWNKWYSTLLIKKNWYLSTLVPWIIYTEHNSYWH